MACVSITDYTDFPYDLNQADKSIVLPKILDEISGLSYVGEDKVYCIQDEDGFVFIYDMLNEEILSKFQFGKKGDYEGVAVADEYLFVLKSNGTLFRMNLDGIEPKEPIKKITTFLDAGYDTEGLCFDRENNRLLIACKGTAGKDLKNKKVIYAFDLESFKLIKKPAFIIDLDDLKEKSSHKSDKKFVFNPSAIAIHPVSNDLYILSSKGKTLVVLSGNGDIRHAIHINQSQFKQPEGITFSENGKLFISNEGRKTRGNIKTFTYLMEN